MVSVCPVCLQHGFQQRVQGEPQARCGACGFTRTDSVIPPLAGPLPPRVREVCTAAIAAQGAVELLEIGCGDGVRLSEAAAIGLAVMGVEADDQARAAARQRLPGCFISGDVAQLPPHGFDLLLLSGILEEIEDPYPIFHLLFAGGAITPRTQVLAELDAARPSRNVWTVQALAALFGNLNFINCEIAKAGDNLFVRATGSDFAGFMQERFVPGTWSELTAYEHLPRYDYAARLATVAQVLDFGCGTGYGASRLALVAEHVLAVDLDQGALAYASAHHRLPNLEFACNADLGASLPGGRFDLITCFEVIEHIAAAEQATLLAQFARLLKPDGVLLISTPNSAVTALYGDNPYHLHELGLDEFRALLAGSFPQTRLLMQRIAAAVFLEAEAPADLLCENSVFPGTVAPAVYIAACGKSALPELPSIIYPDFQRDFITGHMAMLHGRNQHSLDRLRLVKLDAQMAEAAERSQTWLSEKEALSAVLNTALAELHATRVLLQSNEAEFSNHLLRFEQTARALQETEATAEDFRHQLAHTRQQLEQTGHTLEDTKAQAAHVQSRLAQAEQALRETQAAAGHLGHQLQQAEQALRDSKAEATHFRLRLEEIERSTSWRAMRRARPLLALFRPVFRPALRFSWRIWRRLHSRPMAPIPIAGPVEPVWQPRNLALEERLEPVWDEAAAHYKLHMDMQMPARNAGGWLSPYHVKPFHDQGTAARRILHIIPNVFIGGSTQLVIDLVQNLSGAFEHVILTSALWPGGAHQGITVHHVASPDRVAMAALLDELKPDLAHLHYWGLTDDLWYHAAVAALRGRGVPALQNVNTPIAPLVDPLFKAYVFVSHYVLEQFGAAAQASGAALAVIHPGIDLDSFRGLQTAEDAENAIGMVYRLEDDKLREDSIELLIEVIRRRPRTRAYVVGGGRLLEPYLAATERAGVRENFRFTGYVPYATLPGWYERFRIFVAPVWKESFGQVAPFAMSKGCAVAGFDTGALAEICGGHETLGTDVPQTAQLIVDLLDDPARLRRIGAANSIRAQEKFGLQTMIARYTVLYDQLLAG